MNHSYKYKSKLVTRFTFPITPKRNNRFQRIFITKITIRNFTTTSELCVLCVLCGKSKHPNVPCRRFWGKETDNHHYEFLRICLNREEITQTVRKTASFRVICVEIWPMIFRREYASCRGLKYQNKVTQENERFSAFMRCFQEISKSDWWRINCRVWIKLIHISKNSLAG